MRYLVASLFLMFPMSLAAQHEAVPNGEVPKHEKTVERKKDGKKPSEPSVEREKKEAEAPPKEPTPPKENTPEYYAEPLPKGVSVDLDIRRPDGGLVPDTIELSEGYFTNVNLDDDDNDGGSGKHGDTVIISDYDDKIVLNGDDDLSVEVVIQPVKGLKNPSDYYLILDYRMTNLRLHKNKKLLQTSLFPPFQLIRDVTKQHSFYVEGIKPHLNDNYEMISVYLVRRGQGTVSTDRVAMHIATPFIYLNALGSYAGASTDLIERAIAYLPNKKFGLDGRTDPLFVKASGKKVRSRYISIHAKWSDSKKTAQVFGKTRGKNTRHGSLYSSEKGAKIALAQQDAYVVIDGHSNHGAGPAFKGMQTETVEDFMNVSGVGHCIFNKQQEEMPKFNPAAHPDATSVSKNEYGEIGKFYKVPCGKEDLPTLRYAVLYLNSCLSDRYFSSVFTHGVLITSTALNCAKQSSADMLEGLLLGDDEKRLLKRINDVKDLDNTNNYHTIYIDGKPLK